MKNSLKAVIAVFAVTVVLSPLAAAQVSENEEKLIIACEAVQLANALFEQKADDIKADQITDYGVYAFEKLLQLAVDDVTALLGKTLLPAGTDESVSCKQTLMKAKLNLIRAKSLRTSEGKLTQASLEKYGEIRNTQTGTRAAKNMKMIEPVPSAAAAKIEAIKSALSTPRASKNESTIQKEVQELLKNMKGVNPQTNE